VQQLGQAGMLLELLGFDLLLGLEEPDLPLLKLSPYLLQALCLLHQDLLLFLLLLAMNLSHLPELVHLCLHLLLLLIELFRILTRFLFEYDRKRPLLVLLTHLPLGATAAKLGSLALEQR